MHMCEMRGLYFQQKMQFLSTPGVVLHVFTAGGITHIAPVPVPH